MPVLMPDDKIYVSGWTGPGECLSVIDSPDLKAPDCAFRLRTACVTGAKQIHGVPNFVNYNLGALPGSVCDTIQTSILLDAMDNTHLKVYPNPASTVLNIETLLARNETAAIEFFDITGKLVRVVKISGGLKNTTVYVDDLSNGIYSYNLKTDKQFAARGKLVIAR